jgi:pyrimidine deaminase RibD-like protein
MIAQEILTHQFDNTEEYDRILVDLCEMILQAQRKNADHYGLVAACVVDPKGNQALGINHVVDNSKRIHAERAAVRNYEQAHGELPSGCLMITTLSPCVERTGHMAQERAGISCSELMDDLNIHRVYCGYMDPTQDIHTQHNTFDCVATQNEKIQHVCQEIADCFLEKDIDENFADGKVRGKSRPGRVKRSGASCAGSVTDLRRKAKNASGERARMYHWCANMKSGHKK